MPILAVRDVDPDHYKALVDEASDNGRSLSAEVRNFAAEVARRRQAKRTVADLKALRDRVNLTLPDGMTSLDLLREERDSW
jgi:hypothetical protein